MRRLADGMIGFVSAAAELYKDADFLGMAFNNS